MNKQTAKIIKNVSDDCEIVIDSQLVGKTIAIDADTVQTVKCFNSDTGRYSNQKIVNVIENNKTSGYFWFELLEIIKENGETKENGE